MNRPPAHGFRLSVGVACLAALLFAGCAENQEPWTALSQALPFDACDRPVSLDWVARHAAESDAVLLGEMHGHPLGLGVAASLFSKIAALAPKTALAMEFLERDTQSAVDDYLAGRIDRPTFEKRARLHPGDPEPGHAAMIDEAKRRALSVVAANAPRADAKKARLEGFSALRGLPATEQPYFVIPETLPTGRYARDFADMMGGPNPHGAGPVMHASANGESPAASFFRAQALWDATMADSVARAIDGGAEPVVLVVGKFHVTHHGGVSQMLERERPHTKIFTIGMVESLDDKEVGLADAVIVVGPSPSEKPLSEKAPQVK